MTSRGSDDRIAAQATADEMSKDDTGDVCVKVRRAKCRVVKDVPREECARLYPEFTGGTRAEEWRWNLQVRGPMLRADGTEGKDFVVATASLTVHGLRELRDAIDAALAKKEASEPPEVAFLDDAEQPVYRGLNLGVAS